MSCFFFENRKVKDEVKYQKMGLIGAMKEEVLLIHKHMQTLNETTIAGILFVEGLLCGQPIVVCKSGVGKVNAALCTQILIDRFDIDAIVFTGVAGALDPRLEIGDLVISSECMQHDVDVTALGFPKGILPYQEKSIYKADSYLFELAHEVSNVLFSGHTWQGRILSGDQFIASRAKVTELHLDMLGICTEMEGAAVAQVCEMNRIPFVIVRSMSDKADGSAHLNFAEFTIQASENSFKIIEAILKKLLP